MSIVQGGVLCTHTYGYICTETHTEEDMSTNVTQTHTDIYRAGPTDKHKTRKDIGGAWGGSVG